MRIYVDPYDAVRETERELTEMGIEVHPQTMQNKVVADDLSFVTKELQGYSFKLHDYEWDLESEEGVVQYLFNSLGQDEVKRVLRYIDAEHRDRISASSRNPGNSWIHRKDLWDQFRKPNGEFDYTYSERMAPQIHAVLRELDARPDTRQAIISIFTALDARNPRRCHRGPDSLGIGGSWRIPCSMYYQLMRRRKQLDLIYTMRSCDFLTHFVVDLMLALRFQRWASMVLNINCGDFTYFAGSLHSYRKDMVQREAF